MRMEEQYSVGQRVQDLIGSAQGTVTRVVDDWTYRVEWDDGKFAGEQWSHNDLRDPL